MSFPNIIHGSEEETFADTTGENYPVGTKMLIEDGRAFRFTEAGGTALVVGNLNSGVAPVTGTQSENLDTLAAGVTILTGVASTGINPAANLFQYGYVHTDNATTLPIMRIKENPLFASNVGTLTLFTPSPTAIAAGNTVTYIENPWRDVIIHGTPPAAVLVGVCRVALTANQYGWLQTTGPCTCLLDTDTTTIGAIGDPVCASAASDADGSVSGLATATAETNPIIGTALGLIEGNAEQQMVYLQIE